MKKTGLILSVFLLSFAVSLYAAPLELASGKFKLVVYPDTGSFTLYQLSDIGKNRYEPLFDDRNHSATTRFSVSVNGRLFTLAPRSGRPVEAMLTETGIRVEFAPVDDFEVIQLFSFINTVGDSIPQLKIDTIIVNTSGKNGTFAFKALFDTSLGETDGIHFSTDIKSRISAETMLDMAVEHDTVLVSADTSKSLAFYFSSFGATRPERLVVANWERLNSLTWLPSVMEGRSFSTIYTVNDSAVLLFWPEKDLEMNKKMTVSVIIGGLSVQPASTEKQPQTPAIAPSNLNRENVTLEYVLKRIAEIEANPDSASDEELDQLDSLLDQLLSESGEK